MQQNCSLCRATLEVHGQHARPLGLLDEVSGDSRRMTLPRRLRIVPAVLGAAVLSATAMVAGMSVWFSDEFWAWLDGVPVEEVSPDVPRIAWVALAMMLTTGLSLIASAVLGRQRVALDASGLTVRAGLRSGLFPRWLPVGSIARFTVRDGSGYTGLPMESWELLAVGHDGTTERTGLHAWSERRLKTLLYVSEALNRTLTHIHAPKGAAPAEAPRVRVAAPARAEPTKAQAEVPKPVVPTGAWLLTEKPSSR